MDNSQLESQPTIIVKNNNTYLEACCCICVTITILAAVFIVLIFTGVLSDIDM